MSDSDKGLIEAFKDREYRESYAEGFLNSWIAHQLTALRRQRGMTQKQLAERVGTKQSGISRMERDDYGRWSFAALQKTAFALGCRLKVSFESFGSLVKEAGDFSEAGLWRPAFEDDPLFHPTRHWEPLLADPSPLGEIRRKVLPWLWEHGPIEKLAEWLEGYNLPPVGDEITPSEWLLDALPPGDERTRGLMAEQVRKAIVLKRWDVEPPSQRGKEMVRNLLGLAEGLKAPALLGDAMWHVYKRRADLPLEASFEPAPEHPLTRAILPNQPDDRFRELWDVCLRERAPHAMPEYVAIGLIGMARIGLAPNVKAIVEGANQAKDWSLHWTEAVDILDRGFRRLWLEFPAVNRLDEKVIDAAPSVLPNSWNIVIMSAWKCSVSDRAQGAGNLEIAQNVVNIMPKKMLSACAGSSQTRC